MSLGLSCWVVPSVAGRVSHTACGCTAVQVPGAHAAWAVGLPEGLQSGTPALIPVVLCALRSAPHGSGVSFLCGTPCPHSFPTLTLPHASSPWGDCTCHFHACLAFVCSCTWLLTDCFGVGLGSTASLCWRCLASRARSLLWPSPSLPLPLGCCRKSTVLLAS